MRNDAPHAEELSSGKSRGGVSPYGLLWPVDIASAAMFAGAVIIFGVRDSCRAAPITGLDDPNEILEGSEQLLRQ